MVSPLLWIRRQARRVVRVLRRDELEARMQDEIRAHLELETAEHERGGLSPDEARRAALVDFGGVEQMKEQARDARGQRAFEDLAADTRFGVRVLRRRPAFTLVSAATFALGIGAATTMFGLAYGVLLRPLPYADPGRLVVLWEQNIARNKHENVVSAENFQAWRARTNSFTGLAALMPTAVTMPGDGPPERVPGAEVSAGYFTLLGVAPALGRDLTEEDARSQSAIILSDAYWRRRFAADPAIVGRTIRLVGEEKVVVGVMPATFVPPHFGWLGDQQVWLPMQVTEANRGWGRYLLVVGRLRPDVTFAAASAQMTALGSTLAKEIPGDQGWAIDVVPLAAQIAGAVRTPVVVMLIGAALLLAIASTNVATLTISATRERATELALRRAIGATGLRLARQLVTEHVMLGLIGAAAGVALAALALRALPAWLPADTPRLESIAFDRPTFLVAAILAALGTAACATLAARGARQTAAATDWLSGRAGSTRVTRRAGARVLLAAELAIGIVIAAMALLMVRTFVELRAVDLGFTPDRVLAVHVAAPGSRYSTAPAQRDFFDRLVGRVAGHPGVEAVGLTSGRPFGGIGPASPMSNAKRPRPRNLAPVADVRYVDSGAFRVLQVPLVRGELFDRVVASGDTPPVAIINESLARDLWGSEDPIGQPLQTTLFNDIVVRVIGVVGDVHLIDARTAPRGTVYLSTAQFPDVERDLLVRTSGPPEMLVSELRFVAAEIEPTLPLSRVTTLSDLVSRSLAGDRFITLVLVTFALVAVVLTAVGIVGVCWADVVGRRREIGVRLALGGTATSVAALLVRQALRRLVPGLIAGVGLALIIAHAMSSLLFGVGPADPSSLVAATATLAGLAALATLVPTVRALRSAPLRSLREG